MVNYDELPAILSSDKFKQKCENYVKIWLGSEKKKENKTVLGIYLKKRRRLINNKNTH